MTLSLLSDIVIRPAKSKTYLRLMLVLYGFTLGLVFYSSLPLSIQLILFIFIMFRLRLDVIHGQPNPEVIELHFSQDYWFINKRDGLKLRYEALRIVIHNPLFQYIQLLDSKQNKNFILFNDQIPEEQLRQLHLLSKLL